MKLNSLRPVPGRSSLTIVSDARRHLICLPYGVENLHRMSALLGIGRHWFHKDHYDIPVKQRQLIEQLSLIVPTRSIVRITRMSVDREKQEFEKYKAQDKKLVHYCPEWDFMAIHEESPEFDACLCDLDVPPCNS